MKNKIYYLIVCLLVLASACNRPKSDSTDNTSTDPETTNVNTTTATYSMANMSTHCNDSARYGDRGTEGGGMGLSRDHALAAIERYRTNNKGKTTGFHLSKKALDSLFTVYPNANGIWMDLVNPKDIPGLNSSDSIAVIVTVKNNPHYEIRRHSGNNAYISEQECPTMCIRID